MFGQPPRNPRPFWQNIAIGVLLLGIAAVLCRFDVAIVKAADPSKWPGDLRRIFKFSELFAHGFGLFLVLLGIWQLAPERRVYLPRLIACVAFPPAAAHLIKLFVVRRRPVAFLDQHRVPHWPESSDVTWFPEGVELAWNVEYATQSFPSAHAALVCSLAIGMCFIFPRGRAMFVLVAIIASLQRVVFYAHWPSDVAVGASLAFLIAGGLVQDWGIGGLCGKLESRRGQSSRGQA